MNAGADFRGSRLRSPADFCIGATLDLGREPLNEVRLARSKAGSGAQFFITQPIFDPADARRFLDAYAAYSGEEMAAPVFFGLQVLKAGGVLFSSIPELGAPRIGPGPGWCRNRAGTLPKVPGIRYLQHVYLVPPIARGGARDYEAAQQFLAAVGRSAESPC